MTTSLGITNYLSSNAAIEVFFESRLSRALSCIPLAGNIVGVARVIFSLYQYSGNAQGWSEDRVVVEVKRGVLEAIGLGAIVFIIEYCFDKTLLNSSSSAPAQLSHAEPQCLFPNYQVDTSLTFSQRVKEIAEHFQSFTPSSEQKAQYNGYSSRGSHSKRTTRVFENADCFMRHGLMHACFVAMMIPVFLRLYKELGHPEAQHLNDQDIETLQLAAMHHDLGRLVKNNDLGRDNPEMEHIGEDAAYHYLKNRMGLSEEKAREYSATLTKKDNPLTLTKPLIQQLMQNADCLAVLRADDWLFDEKFLDLFKWINLNIPDAARRDSALEKLHLVIDSANFLLCQLGDCFFKHKRFSTTYSEAVVEPNFDMANKSRLEKMPECYDHMCSIANTFHHLKRH